LNRHGESFLEAAHLFGLAIEEDCRNVVVDDVDGDGRMDVIVISVKETPQIQFTLHVFHNEMQNVGNWIEFQFDPGRGKSTSIGAKLSLDMGDYKTVRQLVAGDSYRSQSPLSIHVGLGQKDRVELVTITWLDGATEKLVHPAINQRHRVKRPQ
jgi:hypothetical protein